MLLTKTTTKMKEKVSFLTSILLLAFFVVSCNAYYKSPEVTKIENQFHRILPEEKTQLSTIVRINEVKAVITILAEHPSLDLDAELKEQVLDLHAIVSFNRENDSIIVNNSTINLDRVQDPQMKEALINITEGFNQMVTGAFMQLSTMIINPLFHQQKTDFKKENDNAVIRARTSDTDLTYTFSEDNTIIEISGKAFNQNATGLIRAKKIDDILAMYYQEFNMPELMAEINIEYHTLNNHLLPKEIVFKNKAQMMTTNYVLTFSDWTFE